MEISSQDPYRHLTRYQRPVTIPEKTDPITIPEYERPELSPEKRLKLQEKIETSIDRKREDLQAERDALRELTAGYVGLQSKKTQWEIYLSVETGGDVDPSGGEGIEFIGTLRDIRKQNNLVKAYATYHENASEA